MQVLTVNLLKPLIAIFSTNQKSHHEKTLIWKLQVMTDAILILHPQTDFLFPNTRTVAPVPD